MMPLYQTGAFDQTVGMLLATLLGMGFGFVLERSGFGRADVLSAQFFGTDMRVLKVMFTAIATVALGLGALSGMGLVDMSAVKIPETFLAPQIVGGLLLGVGFVISGYCPGTAVVAAGSGHIDGLWSLGGVMIGSLLFGFVYPLVEGLYTSGGMGVVTLPDVLGLPWPVVAALVLAMAIGSFVLAERLERRFAASAGVDAPPPTPGTRNKVFGLLGAVAALGLATLLLPPPVVSAPPSPELASLGPIDLAQRLAAGDDLYVVDVRAPADCQKATVPGARCLPADDPNGKMLSDLPATRPLVLVTTAARPLPAGLSGYGGRVLRLDGGYEAFRAQVLDEPKPPTEATPDEIAAYRLRAALHGFFTGSKAPAAAAPAPAAPKARATKKGGGC